MRLVHSLLTRLDDMYSILNDMYSILDDMCSILDDMYSILDDMYSILNAEPVGRQEEAMNLTDCITSMYNIMAMLETPQDFVDCKHDRLLQKMVCTLEYAVQADVSQSGKSELMQALSETNWQMLLPKVLEGLMCYKLETRVHLDMALNTSHTTIMTLRSY